LGLAFDTTDIAKLRDRARLHITVDRVMAHVVDEFARNAAQGVGSQIDAALVRATSLVSLRWTPNDAAAHAFGGDPGTSLWSGDVRVAIAATIVLEAIGGPAIALVHDIGSRFASRQVGTYMKRELVADLRAEIFPRLRGEILAFSDRVAVRLQHVYDDLAQALASATVAKRDAELGSIDRALAAHELGAIAPQRAALTERRERLESERAQIDAAVVGFMEREEEIAPADAGPVTVRAAHADASTFDTNAYDRGLRPSRWRVAILGALRRGKSSLINAIAGRIVLTDDIAGSVRFPIHVRYGEIEQAFALAETGEWREIAFETASLQAADRPVLVLVPWTLPRELVLVHAPAFDSGDAAAEDVSVVAASHASEVLCLFSRQLSDRELSLYERVAEFNKPMIFAHTFADNEASNERRHVVELASEYLQARNIPTERVFVVSSQEYDEARSQKRAAAGWNEMGALRSTLEGHAESHMARLDRLARSAAERSGSATAKQSEQAEERPKGLLSRLFGKGR